jgi:YHS domain-containing protein
MKQLISLTALVLALVGFAGAQTSKQASLTPKTISCAVLGGPKFDIAKATANHMYADYKGRRYFFCCGGCPEEFKKNPAKYSKSPSIPTPKPAKKK